MTGLRECLAAYEFAHGVWGESDCLIWALACAHAAGGGDHRGRIPHYRTRLGALRALKRCGFGSLEEALNAHLTPIPAAEARAGDIALAAGDQGFPALGVVIGRDTLFLDARGYRAMPTLSFPVWKA